MKEYGNKHVDSKKEVDPSWLPKTRIGKLEIGEVIPSLHEWNGTKWQVTDYLTAITLILGSEDATDDMLKLARDWLVELCVRPAMPDILAFCFALGKCRL